MIRLVLWSSKMTGDPCFTPPPPKLLDQVRDRLRVKHYSIRIETQYPQWMQRLVAAKGAETFGFETKEKGVEGKQLGQQQPGFDPYSMP